MKHFGDITKINGAEVPLVDIITGGSPCQDLSVAGKRAGLKHSDKGDEETTRSGLFMEQIRIVKEMRNESIRQLSMRGATYDMGCIQPRYMVWENVPGAFSSNNGEDFRCVLEETAKIVEECANIPRPKKWSNAGCIMGNGWSIAWRIHNSQYWGVPQRRRRLCLVADFNGGTAPNILFELLGEADEGNPDKYCGCIREEHRREIQNECGCLSGDIKKGKREKEGNSVIAFGNIEKAICIDEKVCYRKTAHPRNPYEGQGWEETKINDTLNAYDNGEIRTPTVVVEKKPILFDPRSQDGVHRMYDDGICPTLNTAQGGQRQPCVCDSIVRRLTPLECERLQGYPTIRRVRFTEMTKDEYIAWNINEGHIVVDTEYGKVFATRGPGGIKLDEPKELIGSVVNGYRVVNIRNGNTKIQCRIHRIVWIAEHGVIPDGYVIDHINNDKQDNRLCNLQLLTAAENSTKARADGLYKIHGEAGQAKITDEVHDFIQYVYGNTDLSVRQLSEIFGISKSRVYQIIHDDGWTDIGDWTDSKGKKHKGDADSPRYKALGNSIALPFWQWMAERIAEVLREEGNENPTMASLFDGIGGFALVFKECGVEPVWASEVEEFCIAVTKKHFPDAEEMKEG